MNRKRLFLSAGAVCAGLLCLAYIAFCSAQGWTREIVWAGDPWTAYTAPGEGPEFPDAQTIRLTLKSGQRALPDVANVDRSEIVSKVYWPYGEDVWVEFEMKVDEGEPISSNWIVLGQLHQTEDPGEHGMSPIFAQYLYDGQKLAIVARSSKEKPMTRNGAAVTLYRDEHYQLGHWDRWKYHFRIARGENGLIDGWRNGEHIFRYEGPVGFNETRGPHWQMGAYRSASPETVTVEYRNFRLLLQ